MGNALSTAPFNDFDAAIKLDPTYAAAYNAARPRPRQTGTSSTSRIADFSQAIKLDPKKCARLQQRGFATATARIRPAVAD